MCLGGREFDVGRMAAWGCVNRLIKRSATDGAEQQWKIRISEVRFQRINKTNLTGKDS